MKIGILGAGSIAKVMAKTLNQMEEVCCYAIATREYERAKAFKKSMALKKLMVLMRKC